MGEDPVDYDGVIDRGISPARADSVGHPSRKETDDLYCENATKFELVITSGLRKPSASRAGSASLPT
jgi:hypothetical protein